MSQARVLSDREVRKVLLFIAGRKHASRNRALVLLSHYTGMRVGELVSIRLGDVLTPEAEIKDEIRLKPSQTKGDRGRVVLLPKKAQDEIRQYLLNRFNTKDLRPVLLTDLNRALFTTQKHPDRGFTPNTGAQVFHYIYRGAGISGASSHSGRRGFITNLAAKGVAARVLMQLSGHRSLQVLQRYIDTDPQTVRKAVELI
jgi:integrase/recombinase XerD